MIKSFKTSIAFIIALGILIFMGYQFLILMSGRHPTPPRTELLNEFVSTQTVEIQAYEDQEYIHGLLLEVEGNISDSLIFTFGMNDSATYRAVKFAPGIVEFRYNADWYSPRCFLTFIPTKDSLEGELQIEYKFFGD